MKKYFILIGLAGLLSKQPVAQSIDFSWGHSFGDRGIDHMTALATDKSGNVYITGNYIEYPDFNPGEVKAKLINSEDKRAFIASYDGASGSFLWAMPAESLLPAIFSAPESKYKDIAIGQNAGNSYIAVVGMFKGWVDMDPTEARQIIQDSNYDYVLAIYDLSGNYIAHRVISSDSSLDGNIKVIFTTSGNRVFVAGEFTGDLTLAEGTTLKNRKSRDIFVASFDIQDNKLAYKASGILATDSTEDAVLETFALYQTKDEVLLGGYFDGAKLDFTSSTKKNGIINRHQPGGNEGFVLNLTSSLEYQWGISVGNEGNNASDAPDVQVRAINAEYPGKIYVAGDFRGKAEVMFNQSGETKFKASSAGKSDGYFIQLDENGKLLKGQVISTPENEVPHQVQTDEKGNVIIGGTFEQDLVFDAIGLKIKHVSAEDLFILVYNDQLSIQGGIGITGNENISITDLEYNSTFSSLWLGADFPSNLTVNPLEPENALSSNGGSDMALAKYSYKIVPDRFPTGFLEQILFSKMPFNVYPNPANNWAFAELPSHDKPQYLQVYDLTGRLRAEQRIPSFETTAKIDIQHLEPGLYLVTWNVNGNPSMQFKLVIQ